MASLVKSVLPTLVGGIMGRGFAANVLGIGKKAKAAQQLPMPTRNDAAMAAERNDLLARRRGLVSTMISGARGSEASTVGTVGGKSALGA